MAQRCSHSVSVVNVSIARLSWVATVLLTKELLFLSAAPAKHVGMSRVAVWWQGMFGTSRVAVWQQEPTICIELIHVIAAFWVVLLDYLRAAHACIYALGRLRVTRGLLGLLGQLLCWGRSQTILIMSQALWRGGP